MQVNDLKRLFTEHPGSVGASYSERAQKGVELRWVDRARRFRRFSARRAFVALYHDRDRNRDPLARPMRVNRFTERLNDTDGLSTSDF
jgi:hypothetical protein